MANIYVRGAVAPLNKDRKGSQLPTYMKEEAEPEVISIRNKNRKIQEETTQTPVNGIIITCPTPLESPKFGQHLTPPHPV